MTPEQQRLAIANVCKVKALYSYALPARTLHCDVPDFSDLNAMHEVEKMLTDEQYSYYGWHLLGEGKIPCREVLSATALQRAEAFLKTLNLWTGK